MENPESTANKMLSTLFEVADIMQNGVLWLNAEGRILGVNEAYASELGYDKAAFKPKTIIEVNPSTSLRSWKRLWKKLLAERQIIFKTEQITATRSIYPVQMRAKLMELDGQFICMAVIENLMRSNRYKDLLEMTAGMAEIATYEFDLVQNEIIVTDEFYRLLNMPPQEKISTKEASAAFRDYISEEDLPTYLKNINRSVKEGKPFEQELSYRVNGEYRDFTFSAQPVTLEDQTIKIYGTIQSLAKVSKRTDEMHFTKYCMDFAQNMIFWVTEDGIISYANQQACDTLGYTKDELIGQSSLLLTRETVGEQSWLEIWEEMKPKSPNEIEIEIDFYTKSGTSIPICISMNIISFKGKKINCSFARNMTKIKEMDELIAMAKESLDQSTDMIYWLKPDASFRYFNEAFVKQVGYTRKEIEKMTIVDLFPETDMEDFKENWARMQQGVTLKALDRKMHVKGGQVIPTSMTVNLVKVNEKEYSATVLRNISDQKRKDKELRDYIKQIEQLQESVEAENIQLRGEINVESNFSNIISRDPNYKKVLRQVEQVADTEATVLILGETGTGKELLARAVHQLSGRADYPMIKINCAALPENLIESELFGHEKGAFTGAHQQKIGKFERADKGTIFLDEIGELPLDLQTKLLRVLQEGEIERVGGTQLIHVDVRVIAATNRNLEQQVVEGKFREDLYYRINVFPILNIPLRERREDIPILVKHFGDKYSKKLNKHITEISPSSLNKLMDYYFLGNVRELENIVERAVILAKSNVLTIDLSINSQPVNISSKFKSMEEMQKVHIIDALKRTKGKVSGRNGAASLLKMNDKTLYSRMKKLGVDKHDYLI